VRPFESERVMEREADDDHLDAVLNPDLLEGASELNTLLQEGTREGGERPDVLQWLREQNCSGNERTRG